MRKVRLKATQRRCGHDAVVIKIQIGMLVFNLWGNYFIISCLSSGVVQVVRLLLSIVKGIRVPDHLCVLLLVLCQHLRDRDQGLEGRLKR